jgi:hypothetical protein
MTLYIKGTDIQIRGTLESMKGVAQLAGLNEDGTLIYVGEVDVLYDETETIFHAGYPVWVGLDDQSYEEFHGVAVEDRRPDGTVINYAGVTDDSPEDELLHLLNLVIAKANSIIDQPAVDKGLLMGCEVIRMHTTNMIAGLEKNIQRMKSENE